MVLLGPDDYIQEGDYYSDVFGGGFGRVKVLNGPTKVGSSSMPHFRILHPNTKDASYISKERMVERINMQYHHGVDA